MGSLTRSLLKSNIPAAAACSEQDSKQQQQQLVSASHHEASEHHHPNFMNQVSEHHIPYGLITQPPPHINSSSSTLNPSAASNFNIGKDGGGPYDLGEFDQALFMYLDGQSPNSSSSSLQQHKANSGMRPATLNIFPSQPMHVEPSSSTKVVNDMGLVNIQAGSKRLLSDETNSDQKISDVNVHPNPSADPPLPKAVKREGNPSLGAANVERDRPKTPDAKTLRRLAQNREAARKSRLRKKAYIQQLESSRVRLTQLEQEIQKSARAQGYGNAGNVLLGENGLPHGIVGNLSPVVFDLEYMRWVEEHQRMMIELRAAAAAAAAALTHDEEEHLGDNELRLYVENCLSHLNEIMNLKSVIAKTDVFHLLSGTWKTAAERCFMWIGGFRPSDIIKIVLNNIELELAEEQLIVIYGLQQSMLEAEEALSRGMDDLNQSLANIIISDSLSAPPPNIANYMGQMSSAMGKLSSLEAFVRQADHMRQQIILRLHQVLTSRQSAKSILAVSEYFHRLRTLSSLWLARPRQD